MKLLSGILLLLASETQAFIKRKHRTIKMMNINYISESDIIYKYRNLLTKDNYNNIMQNVLDNKIEKIFVNNDYKQIITLDNLPKTDILLDHYHIANINPIILPNLIDKTTIAHVPIYFTDFDAQTIFSFQNAFGIFNTLGAIINFIIPVFFLINIISFLSSQNMMRNGMPNGMPNNRMFNFMDKSKDEFKKPNVTLSSWAGSPEVLEECVEVITYIFSLPVSIAC
jgi:hypothetical protein